MRREAGHTVQTTLKSAISLEGVGLHSGKRCRMVVRPASVEHGIWFRRVDVEPRKALIPAQYHVVEQTPLCTRLVNDHGTSVSTVEHIMAALAGCGVHNALLDVDGPEIPVRDGSSAEFVKAFLSKGFTRQTAPVRAIEILGPVTARRGEAWARLSPSSTLNISFEIDFADSAIGQQALSLNMANGSFVRELCDSRTFCRNADIHAMRAQGLALGGSVENAVVVDGADVLTPGGLRHEDEAVRHKMLDALGDLALAGCPILGHYEGHRAGHSLTNELLRRLFAAPQSYRLVTCSPAMSARLPGVGVHLEDLPEAC